MSKVISFEEYVQDNTPHCAGELICIGCHKRWIGVWPEKLWLKDITCPYCNTQGLVISTGQLMEEE